MTTRDDHHRPGRCQQCDGTGWVDCGADRRHAPYCTTPASCACRSQVEPCRCSAGKRTGALANAIHRHNDQGGHFR
jgi:hypothetical protein